MRRNSRSPKQNGVGVTRAQREGSPIIGGGKAPGTALGALPAIGDPYGMKSQQRPRPTLANAGQVQV